MKFNLNFDLFPKSVINPPLLAESDQYVIKLAETAEEVEKALRLRYEVFNLEQGKGLERANKIGMDVDEFDEYCLHLIVVEKSSSKIVGTYRLHLGSVAKTAMGFYSSQEYLIEGLEPIAHVCMELGRSCVSPEYRTGAGVALLWGGIGELMMRAKLRYLLGCVSLEDVSPAVGWALHKYFISEGKICDYIKSKPKSGFVLEKPSEAEIEKVFADKSALRRLMPPLFKGYLRVGALICGEPVFDRAFGTIDFLIILDSAKAHPRYTKHYNYQCEAER